MSRRNPYARLVGGILLAIGVNIVAFWVYFGLVYLLTIVNQTVTLPLFTEFLRSYNWLLPPILFSVFQWLYIAPLVLWLRRQNRSELARGVLAGALLLMLINGACYAWMRIPG